MKIFPNPMHESTGESRLVVNLARRSDSADEASRSSAMLMMHAGRGLLPLIILVTCCLLLSSMSGSMSTQRPSGARAVIVDGSARFASAKEMKPRRATTAIRSLFTEINSRQEPALYSTGTLFLDLESLQSGRAARRLAQQRTLVQVLARRAGASDLAVSFCVSSDLDLPLVASMIQDVANETAIRGDRFALCIDSSLPKNVLRVDLELPILTQTTRL